MRFGLGFTLGMLLIGAVLGGYSWSWFNANVLSTLPKDLSEYRTWRPPTSVVVRDTHGDVFDEFAVERRFWVELDSLPPHVWQAFIAAEDRRFFEHPGVDLLGIGRAAIENARAGSTVQGGSTLTQQLVKNLLVGDERSIMRKVKEAVLAYRLEKELGKERVLEMYLNYVFLGSGNYGIEAAARDYFDVPAAELNPGQAAMIAGLVPAPSRYSPRRNAELAKWRRAIVLRSMADAGFVNPIDALDFLSDPVLQDQVGESVSDDSVAYATMVRREIRRLLGAEVPFQEGYTVFTPYDPELQAVASDAAQKAREAHLERQGPRSVLQRTGVDAEAFLGESRGLKRDANGLPVLPDDGSCFPARVPRKVDLTKLEAGPFVLALERSDWWMNVHDERIDKARPLLGQLSGGELLRVCRSKGKVTVARKIWAEAAIVVLDHRTGFVRALVGGADTRLEGFVRATQARRQPGSSFKPYVYAAAFAHGHTPVEIMSDTPLALPGGNGQLWSPKNYSGGYSGPMTLRKALAASVNTIAVRLALDVGPAEVARTARRLGVRTPLRHDLTIALGSSEVTPMDQALGYASFVRAGVATDPVYISELRDGRGRIVAKPGEPLPQAVEEGALLPGGPGIQAVSPGVAYAVLDTMREVVRAGTARRAYKPDRDQAGKTGTTNDYIDAWFVGVTPRHVIAVWVGTDSTLSLGFGETGGRAALPAWMQVADALGEPAGERFAVPEEVVLVPTGDGWVGLPRGQVPSNLLQIVLPRDAREPLPVLSQR